MTSGQIVGKMDTQKQLNVPLHVAAVKANFPWPFCYASPTYERGWGVAITVALPFILSGKYPSSLGDSRLWSEAVPKQG